MKLQLWAADLQDIYTVACALERAHRSCVNFTTHNLKFFWKTFRQLNNQYVVAQSTEHTVFLSVTDSISFLSKNKHESTMTKVCKGSQAVFLCSNCQMMSRCTCCMWFSSSSVWSLLLLQPLLLCVSATKSQLYVTAASLGTKSRSNRVTQGWLYFFSQNREEVAF